MSQLHGLRIFDPSGHDLADRVAMLWISPRNCLVNGLGITPWLKGARPETE